MTGKAPGAPQQEASEHDARVAAARKLNVNYHDLTSEEIEPFRAAATAPAGGVTDIGNLEYQGNSVSHWHSKAKAYGDTVLKAWQMLADAGYLDSSKRENHLLDMLRAALTTAARAAEPEGLPVTQEPKYTVNGTHIVNRASGEAIPHDEPVFIFRARDLKALNALYAYHAVIDDDAHTEAVWARVMDFRRFALTMPDRMKEPDTSPTPPTVTSKEGPADHGR